MTTMTGGCGRNQGSGADWARPARYLEVRARAWLPLESRARVEGAGGEHKHLPRTQVGVKKQLPALAMASLGKQLCFTSGILAWSWQESSDRAPKGKWPGSHFSPSSLACQTRSSAPR